MDIRRFNTTRNKILEEKNTYPGLDNFWGRPKNMWDKGYAFIITKTEIQE